MHGPLARQIPRDHSFYPFTILQNDVLEVPDARLDERFAGSPLVVGDPCVRFYAGALLLTRSGVALGTLGVLDPRPSQRRLMVIAAAHIAAQLECRRAVLQLLEQKTLATESRDALTASNRRQQELTAMMVHDFKSPLAVLELDATFLVDDLSLAQPQREVAREIMDAGRQLSGMVSDLLDVSSSEDGQLILQRLSSRPPAPSRPIADSGSR